MIENATTLVVEERGRAVTLSLPPADTERWSPRRKAAVVAATRTGVITRSEACTRYRLSPEELSAWEAALDENGIPGLRTTRQQIYRVTAALAKARRTRMALVVNDRANGGTQGEPSKSGPALAAAG
jgi:transposase-like protein